MKAAVTREAGIIKMEDVPEPEMAPNQVKVKIAYAGLCGTDPENLEHRFGLMPPEAYKGARILGHEASGTIAAVGKNVKNNFKVGQRVAMNFRGSCGACWYCQNGKEHYCRGGSGASGCFAEYAVYPESAIYPLADDISFEIGAMLEPVSVAVHAIDQAKVITGSSVAICGGGPIGLLCLEMALKAGAARTLLSEPVAEKRALAKKLGADVTVDPFNEDLEAIGKKLTDGRGFNTVIDASGSVKAAKQCLSLADNCGTILWAAVYGKDVEIGVSPFLMYAKELTITSTFVSPYSFPRALALLPKLELQSLITDIVDLKDIQQAFDMHKKGKSIKILIKM
ncbi:MAG: alcohol dehydrogenase catalytic domain-containing protein [Dehalococcoidales bacterium]|jgi:(R,R)-butanediol dehydrogenase/meso-butanediol dehydrogenase/diacetyl reductase/L-iditol 2-dehydrogenase